MKNVWDSKEFRWRIRQPWKLPRFVFENIKYSWQRITKGYCDKDLWNIDGWFMDIMPNMLQQFKENRNGSPGVLGSDYVNADGILCNDACHEEWDKILDEMIFLFREMNEETCKRKNPYEKEHEDVAKEFEKKYGLFGEKLEREESGKTFSRRMHFPREIDEYREVENNFYEAEKELDRYRENCKNQAFILYAKWFFYLWD